MTTNTPPMTPKTPPAESGGAGLLPCPFCGSQYGPFINRAKYTTWDKDGNIFGPYIIVECDNCGAETNGHESDESFAIQAWNTRAEPQPASNAGEGDRLSLPTAPDSPVQQSINAFETLLKCDNLNMAQRAMIEVELGKARVNSEAGHLDPDMPAQELRLAMGELTAAEERLARAAIRWANSRQSPGTGEDDAA